MKSNAPKGNIFSEVLNIATPQARFDLSYYSKLTCNHGQLIPFLCQEIVPGDKFNVATLALVRLQALIAPAMQDIDIEMRYFYVPNRLIHDNFENFMAGDTATGQVTATHPYYQVNNSNKAAFGIGSLADYLGYYLVDLQGNETQKINVLPFRAYNLIWNEYFRDESIQSESPISKADGNDSTTQNKILPVALKKDYFTSALPFAQKGYSSQASGVVILNNKNNAIQKVVSPPGSPNPQNLQITRDANSDYFLTGANISSPGNALIDPNGTLTTIMQINELRRANAVQRFLERSAVGGNRYSEWLLSHFGVHCSDSRLQRPEYLGGGRCPVVMSEIAQTAPPTDPNTQTPLGTLAGKASGSPLMSFRKPFFFPEYGWLIGVMYIRPKATYCQGLHKKWTRFDRFDYYLPEFAYLGEQEVKKSEIYNDVHDGLNNDTFGYQSRYAEYKFNSNELHGQFRSTLQYWTMPRIFANRPALNGDFLKAENMPYNIFAVTAANTDHYLIELYNKIDAVRPMPRLAVARL